MHVRGYVRTRCAHRHRYECVYSDRCHAHRWVHVYLSPSIQLNICVCMDIRLYLDACTSERRRGERGRAVVAGARAGASALGAASASGYNHRCASQAHAGVCACMRGLLCMASARSAPRPSLVARRARAARARGARQVHLLHEGEGAPRVARPVQALGGTVRPALAAAAAAVRDRGGAGAAIAAVPALRCCACAAAPGAGPHHAALVCGGGGVAGRQPRARMAGARGRPTRDKGWAGAARRGRTVVHRDASSTKLAALPAAVDWPWPNLKRL